jgi:hypothetical protein
MSGGVPKRVWQGRMRTKTNQTGMKVQGFPSMIGRRNINTKAISNRVNQRIVICGAGTGWRCRHGVNGATAGAAAKKKYCKEAPLKSNPLKGIICVKPQPLSRNLAGGVGHDITNTRLNTAQGTCGKGALTVCTNLSCGGDCGFQLCNNCNNGGNTGSNTGTLNLVPGGLNVVYSIS